VTAAIAAQNLIVPAGTQKIGTLEYFVKLNASPVKVAQLNDLPVATRNGSVVYVRDVAHVRDGAPPQTNIVRQERPPRGVDEHSQDRDELDARRHQRHQAEAAADPGPPASRAQDPGAGRPVDLRPRGPLGVVREATTAAVLTGLMVLLFLGSWRSTVIIFVSIPLSILASIVCLSALGQTINIMTLAGLRWRSAFWWTMRR